MTDSQTPTGTAHVLVVDDDASLLRLIDLALASAGIRVTVAKDGVEGLERLEAEKFDLVILDLQMPRMDGREMFRELRIRGHEAPVMLLSAYGAERARDELRAEAAMTKPFDIDELIDRVRILSLPWHTGGVADG